MNRLRSVAARLWRAIAGEDSALERLLRRRRRLRLLRRQSALHRAVQTSKLAVRKRTSREFTGKGFAVLWADRVWERRTGIYLKGSCDLPAVFAAAPQIREAMEGVCCIREEPGGVSNARSDVMLQTLDEPESAVLAPAMENLNLPAAWFKPRVFEPRFRIPEVPSLGEFPKSVIVLSIASDVVRTVYRHREHGFLVDPGGWWLNQDMTHVMTDLSAAQWFRTNFKSLGRISVEDFQSNYRKLVKTLQERTGAEILVFNTLVVEPGSTDHSYRFVKNSHAVRRRQFNLALTELSRELGFSIVDVDRILKTEGVREQVDFAHFPPERFRSIATEVFRIMADRGVFETQ